MRHRRNKIEVPTFLAREMMRTFTIQKIKDGLRTYENVFICPVAQWKLGPRAQKGDWD